MLLKSVLNAMVSIFARSVACARHKRARKAALRCGRIEAIKMRRIDLCN